MPRYPNQKTDELAKGKQSNRPEQSTCFLDGQAVEIRGIGYGFAFVFNDPGWPASLGLGYKRF